MNNKTTHSHTGDERRKHSHIRDIFDDAYRAVYPLLKSHGETSGVTSHSMLHQTLQNAFPNLHKQDLPILVASLTRVFREQNKSDTQ
jgi:hypothetical protein